MELNKIIIKVLETIKKMMILINKTNQIYQFLSIEVKVKVKMNK